MRFDPEIGWVVTENYRDRFGTMLVDAAGHPYSARYSTGRHGFRLWGEPPTNGPRVMIVGDSFTHAVEISAEYTYAAVVGRALGAEVYAYGAQGYGTLQEYLLVRRHLREIMPDLLLWQWCSNDFINNDLALELRSPGNNNHSPRPFLLEDGSVTIRVPEKSNLAAGARYLGARYSRFVAFLWARYDLHEAATGIDRWALEQEIGRMGNHHAGFRRAAATTRRIAAMARQRWPELPIVAFVVDDTSPFFEEFRAIASENEIEFLDGVPERLRQATREGITVRAADGGHWNAHGHRVAGEYLTQRLAVLLGSHDDPR